MTDSLPNDLQTLKALFATQRAEIERLKMMTAKLRRTQFGRSSEQLEVSQTELTPPTEPPPRPVSRRKPLPEHLSCEIHVHQPESQCPGCGETLRHLGEDVVEELEYVPSRFVIRHVRPKLVCRCCEHIAQVPAPSPPIARGLAGPGLLGQIARGNIRALTSRFSGILQADGYAGFAQLYATGTIQEAACWAHARRTTMSTKTWLHHLPPNARCAPSLWGAKITCLSVPMTAENERLQFTVWSLRPSSTT